MNLIHRWLFQSGFVCGHAWKDFRTAACKISLSCRVLQQAGALAAVAFSSFIFWLPGSLWSGKFIRGCIVPEKRVSQLFLRACFTQQVIWATWALCLMNGPVSYTQVWNLVDVFFLFVCLVWIHSISWQCVFRMWILYIARETKKESISKGRVGGGYSWWSINFRH